MHSDFLFIVAEIAAAFVGFSSLVAVISSRTDRTPEREEFDFYTLRNVLLLSLMAIFFALLPNLLERLSADARLAWRISAAIYSGVIGLYIVYTWPLFTRTYRGIGRSVPATFHVNALALFLCAIAQTFAAVDRIAADTYLIGLSVLLYNAGFGFVRLFVSLRPQSQEE